MSASGWRTYPYYRPVPADHKAANDPPDFYHVRTPGLDGRSKGFIYRTQNPAQPWNYRAALLGHPKAFGRPYRAHLYQWRPLWRELTASRADRAGTVLWCEGEKDADNARRAWGVVATSHHGGAEMATEEQAEHFRGYRGRVLVLADRDDPGYACAYGRWRMVRAVGVRAEVVRPWNSVVPAGRCVEPPCHCPRPCPPANRLWVGADLSDHIAEGLRLRELVVVRERHLARAAERWLIRQAEGARYWGGGAA